MNVELAAPAEVSKALPYGAGEGLVEAGKMTGMMLVAGGAVTVLGPPGGGAGIVGAGLSILMSPFTIVEGSLNASQREAILRAIEATDFPARLKRALQRRLEHVEDLRLDVAIRSYGFVGQGSNATYLCFATSMDIDATDGKRLILHEELTMSKERLSEDVPPPECAQLADIAADDGCVARRVLGDAAEILAAVIVKHVKTKR